MGNPEKCNKSKPVHANRILFPIFVQLSAFGQNIKLYSYGK